MADEKITPADADARATDEVENQDKRELDKQHPGYKYHRKTRQFGG
jgi:hypothetical protein